MGQEAIVVSLLEFFVIEASSPDDSSQLNFLKDWNFKYKINYILTKPYTREMGSYDVA
jgi:hypothetical protein